MTQATVTVKFYNRSGLASVEDIINAYAQDEGGTRQDPRYLGLFGGEPTVTITWRFPTMWRACWFIAKLSNTTIDIVHLTMDAKNYKEA